MKPIKPKTCRVCDKTFVPGKSTQVVCSAPCAIKYAREKGWKKVRQTNREKLQKLKTKGDYIRELQTLVNKFIRKRDEHQPCISCDTRQSKWDAGHFYSTKAYPNLRFNEDNIHKQCVTCNQHKHGNIHEYSVRLRERIGESRYQALGAIRSTPLRLSIPEIIELKAVYKQKIKELNANP